MNASTAVYAMEILQAIFEMSLPGEWVNIGDLRRRLKGRYQTDKIRPMLVLMRDQGVIQFRLGWGQNRAGVRLTDEMWREIALRNKVEYAKN